MQEEVKILEMHHEHTMTEVLQQMESVVTMEVLAHARNLVRKIHVEHKLLEFIARITWETRNDRSLYLGASPRASIALLQVAKALSVLSGRDFVIPEDILRAVPAVLRHRISLTPEKEMEGLTSDDSLKEIVARMEIPR